MRTKRRLAIILFALTLIGCGDQEPTEFQKCYKSHTDAIRRGTGAEPTPKQKKAIATKCRMKGHTQEVDGEY